MSKVVIKRFPDDNVFGSSGPAIARWADKHNARIVSQSASKGWLTVSFEILDQAPIAIEHTIYRGPSSTIIQTRELTNEELRESIGAEIRRETENSQETRVAVTRLEESKETKSEKPKKSWRKR
ncbi:MAG: hypothetical protein ABI354_01695 [Candidatus Saccharimonadales bacterium]